MERLGKTHSMKKWGSVFLLFLSISVCALAGEIILRVLGYHGAPLASLRNNHPVDDEVLDWRYMPNSEYRVGRISYTYNSAGFRDVNHAVNKLRETLRIVVVGDSVTEGYGVQWKAVFSKVIQSELGSGYEVINIGMGGLNTPQEVHLLEQEGLAYEPDLVVLNFVLNDCDFYSSYQAAKRYNLKKDSRIGLLNLPVNPRVKQVLKSSALIYFVKERLENTKGRIFGEDKVDHFTRIWSKIENRLKVTSGFDKLKLLQDENNFDVLVIIWPLLTDYSSYRFKYIHEWVKKEAEKRAFSTIDLRPSFSKISYRDLQVTAEDNIHPNALGHKLAADVFLNWYRPEKF